MPTPLFIRQYSDSSVMTLSPDAVNAPEFLQLTPAEVISANGIYFLIINQHLMHLNDAQIAQIAMIIQNLPNLRRLRLQDRLFSWVLPTSMHVLTQAMRAAPLLSRVELNSSNLGIDDYVLRSTNDDSKSPLDELYKCVGDLQQLTHLSLIWNNFEQLGDQGIQSLIQAFQAPSLFSLDFSGNSFMFNKPIFDFGSRRLEALLIGLQKAKNLRILKLAGCAIGKLDDKGMSLVTTLLKSLSLRTLDLCVNELDLLGHALPMLTDTIAAMPSLEHLSLAHNGLCYLDKERMLQWSRAIVGAQNLTELNLESNGISELDEPSSQILADALAQAKNLTTLHLGGNGFEQLNDRQLLIWARAFQGHPSLKTITGASHALSIDRLKSRVQAVFDNILTANPIVQTDLVVNEEGQVTGPIIKPNMQFHSIVASDNPVALMVESYGSGQIYYRITANPQFELYKSSVFEAYQKVKPASTDCEPAINVKRY